MFIHRSKILAISGLLALGVACGKTSDRPKGGRSSNDQGPTTTLVPGQGSLEVESLPVTAVETLLPLKERSVDEFCLGIQQFLQNYAASNLKGSSLHLVKEESGTCRTDSNKGNLNFHTRVIISKSNASQRLDLAINIVADFEGDRFKRSTVLIDRIHYLPQSFQAMDSDKAFGDMQSFRSSLSDFAQLEHADFRIFQLKASDFYRRVEEKFSPGNQRLLVSQPKMRVEFADRGQIKVREIDSSYFQYEGKKGNYLRCPDLACLQDGLTYSFEGLDLVLHSKPFVDASNRTVKASERIRLTYAHVQ